MKEVVRRMADTLHLRGPDDAGTWADAEAGLAFGHRRLAILDLSPAGHQPMRSACGRYVIAFNGEIYNHLGLREEIGDIAWRGHSDTETLLAGIAAWGLEATLRRCVGMFAIALWDHQERTLQLARDRFGEKPLYYGWVDGAFLFGSELKALKAYPGFAAPVSREALAQYLRFMYVPAPLSIYEGIHKLEPGCLLTLQGPTSLDSSSPRTRVSSGPDGMDSRQRGNDGIFIHCWWSLADAVVAGAQHPITDEAEALHLLEIQLVEAVRLQSLADVPLGAFLSGGVDSSTIVALMQQQAKRDGSAPTKTFTIGFDEAGFDESPHARAVAQHLGTEHHEMRVSARMAQDVIPTLPQMYDEPFADSSQIPSHLVSQAARKHVTVALSGDSGDELFGGYNRYFWGPRIWSRVGCWPYPMRQALSVALGALPASGWDALVKPIGVVRPGEKLHKLARALRGTRTIDDLYRNLVSEWQDPASVVKSCRVETRPGRLSGESLPANDCSGASPVGWLLPGMGSPLRGDDDVPPGLSPDERMMYLDAMTYLPDDILCKVDRATMACSLETRVPFLDHRVAELAWRLPMRMKIRGNTGKWALRQVLYKHVPRELIERPKAGFAIPIGQWLRGPLRDWAEALLNENRLRGEGYFYPGPIRKRWAEHVSGRRDHTASLWAVLMFQVWLESVN